MYSSDQLEAALDALDRQPRKISADDWPGNLENLDMPGLYAWWVDEEGARNLSEGIGLPIAAGRIYIGQAGATRGKRSEATFSSRIEGNHLSGLIRSSTFRRTLAALLFQVLDLEVIGPRKMDKVSEKRLSDWIRAHLEIAVYAFSDRDALKHLEDQVMERLDPPLNLEGMQSSPVRARIKVLRKVISKTDSRRGEYYSGSSKELSRLSITDHSVKRANDKTIKSSITLHEEIRDILQEHGVDGLTPSQIAGLVNKRSRYRKKDGSDVTAFQIHGRTKNYPHLFVRDGSRVRLKNPPSH